MLSEAGFECELLAAEPDRPNLVARLRGRADGPTLAYLGHVDTVKADASEWTRDPWSGDLAEGWVWGRGALDMKGQVASELAAALELARSGWRPEAGALLLAITADEETGGDLGARWLCETHPDKVRCDFAVNEGGGGLIEGPAGRRLYTLSVGEKGIFRAQLQVGGRAGHASQPRIGDNALLKLAALLARISEQPAPEAHAEGMAFLSAFYGESFEGERGMQAGLERLRADAPLIADYIAEPMLGVTLSPTIASAGEKANVIPSSARALIDTRVPPGLGVEEARAAIAGRLGEGGYELSFSEAVVGSASPFATPFASVISDWVGEADPGAELAPIVMAGFSDSHWFRGAFPDAVVYGFCPHREIKQLEASPLIHAADERVPAPTSATRRASSSSSPLRCWHELRQRPGHERRLRLRRAGRDRAAAPPRRHGAPERPPDPRPDELAAAAARASSGEIEVASGLQAGTGAEPDGEGPVPPRPPSPRRGVHGDPDRPREAALGAPALRGPAGPRGDDRRVGGQPRDPKRRVERPARGGPGAARPGAGARRARQPRARRLPRRRAQGDRRLRGGLR